MRTDELRSLLHDRGEEVHDVGPRSRIDAVHERVRTVRRRRAAVAGGGAVAVAVGVVLVVVPGGTQTAPPAEWAANGDYSKDGVTFRHEVLGDQLLGAAIGDPGESEVVLDVTVPEQGLRFSPVCHGVSQEYQVTVSLDGTLVSGQSCRVAKDTDPGLNGTEFLGDPLTPLEAMGIEPGDVVEARAWVSRSDDATQAPVEHKEAVVGLGLYENGGAADVSRPPGLPMVLDHRGERWVLDSFSEAGPGERSVLLAAGRPEQEVLVVASHAGLEAPAKLEVLLDHDYAGSLTLEPDDVVLDLLGGDSASSWKLVDTIDAGSSVLARLEVLEGSTEGAHPALAQYVRASAGQDSSAAEQRKQFRAADYQLPVHLEHDGREWVRSSVVESDPGQRVRDLSTGPRDEPMLLVVAVNGLAPAPGVGERLALVVDGERRDALPYSLEGGWGVEAVLEHGRPHEASLRVASGLTRDTQLAFVLYEPVR